MAQRYPLPADALFRLREGGANYSEARVVDMSSVSVAFLTREPVDVAAGDPVELLIDWPGGAERVLIVWGWVARVDGPLLAIEIRQHDFRTGTIAAYKGAAIMPGGPEGAAQGLPA